MQKYHFFKRGAFESLTKFEKRLNDFADSGWKVVGLYSDNGESVVLMERIKNDL